MHFNFNFKHYLQLHQITSYHMLTHCTFSPKLKLVQQGLAQRCLWASKNAALFKFQCFSVLIQGFSTVQVILVLVQDFQCCVNFSSALCRFANSVVQCHIFFCISCQNSALFGAKWKKIASVIQQLQYCARTFRIFQSSAIYRGECCSRQRCERPWCN